LNYHGARYYAAWLGRWLSCDRAGITEGSNLYQYTRSDPVNLMDANGNLVISADQLISSGQTREFSHRLQSGTVVYVRFPLTIRRGRAGIANVIQIGVRNTAPEVRTRVRQFVRTRETRYLRGGEVRQSQTAWEHDPSMQRIQRFFRERRGMDLPHAIARAGESSGFYESEGGVSTRGPGTEMSILDLPYARPPPAGLLGSVSRQEFQTYIYQGQEGSEMTPIARIDWVATTVISARGSSTTYSVPLCRSLITLPEEERLSPEARNALARFREEQRGAQIHSQELQRYEEFQRSMAVQRRLSPIRAAQLERAQMTIEERRQRLMQRLQGPRQSPFAPAP
jgi:hypothetical protein